MVIDKRLAKEMATALTFCLNSGQGAGDFDLGQVGGNRLPTGRMASDVLRDLNAELAKPIPTIDAGTF